MAQTSSDEGGCCFNFYTVNSIHLVKKDLVVCRERKPLLVCLLKPKYLFQFHAHILEISMTVLCTNISIARTWTMTSFSSDVNNMNTITRFILIII